MLISPVRWTPASWCSTGPHCPSSCSAPAPPAAEIPRPEPMRRGLVSEQATDHRLLALAAGPQLHYRYAAMASPSPASGDTCRGCGVIGQGRSAVLVSGLAGVGLV